MQSLWMLVASLLFAIMGACVKLASAQYAVSEIVAYRGAIGMLMVYLVARWHGSSMRTAMPYQHLTRGVIGVTALWLWFYAMSALPLAMAVTLNYMSPIWIAAILWLKSWRSHGRHLEWQLVLAILLGFAGVLLLLKPSIHANQLLAGCIALISGMLAALAYLQVRQMGLAGEPEYRVVFYFSMTCAIAGALVTSCWPSAWDRNGGWHAHDSHGVLLLLVIGLTAASAQMAMTRAYRLGNTLLTANLQYVGIVFSSGFDILIWHNSLSASSWGGIAIILISGMCASFYNYRSSHKAAAAVSADRPNQVSTTDLPELSGAEHVQQADQRRAVGAPH